MGTRSDLSGFEGCWTEARVLGLEWSSGGGGFERDQVYCVMLGPGRDERRLES